MKTIKLFAILVSIMLLAITAAGCIEIGGNKTTGGGWFFDETSENYITFGFNVQPISDPYYDEDLQSDVRDVKGRFQLIDHTDKLRIHGTFEVGVAELEYTEYSGFVGHCSVDKDGPHLFSALFVDSTDGMGIALWIDLNDSGVEDVGDVGYSGELGGGSIVIHSSEE